MSIKGSGKNATRLQNEYIKNKYDKVMLLLPKATNLKQRIKDHATTRNESVNAFITRSITETIERDNESESE